MLVYVAGPYRGSVDENIYAARLVAIELWEAGHAAICPHLNTAHFERDCEVSDKVYLAGDLDILARCDAVVMVPGWEESIGARDEYDYAKARDIPIYEYPDLPPLHPTEKDSPVQVRTFIDIIMKMYRTHLEKNQDYSPNNILGPGEPGLMTRAWDKTSRLMNLLGFHFEIKPESVRYEPPKEPRFESIEDNVRDLAVYSVNWQIYRRGTWGQ